MRGYFFAFGRVPAVPGVGGTPGLVGFFVGSLGEHEIAGFALGGAQEGESLKSGVAVDRVFAGFESAF